MSDPQILDLAIRQGDDWSKRIQFVDDDAVAIDITGWTELSAEIRRESGAALLASLTVEVETAATGIVLLSLAAADTEDIPQGVYAWDFESLVDTERRTRIAGSVRVTGDITRIVVA